ncbi:unnamed protein product, partial [Amoebophrya sp. A25]
QAETFSRNALAAPQQESELEVKLKAKRLELEDTAARVKQLAIETESAEKLAEVVERVRAAEKARELTLNKLEAEQERVEGLQDRRAEIAGEIEEW